MRALFAAATLAGAFLLFGVQPLLGRLVLPWFGGGPTVWTVCMLFFQAGLLAGYAYAHLLALRLPTRRGVALHLALVGLALLTLPIAPEPPEDAGVEPTGAILAALAGAVGLTYVALAATAPLIQAWAARIERTREPYGLYAWSNAGSMAALLAYPLLIDQVVGVHTQAVGWSVAFGLFAVLLAACGVAAWRRGVAHLEPEAAAPPPSAGRVGLWIALSCAGSTLLLGVTDRISEDVSASPFLWVVPLALYLLTFVLCFGRPGVANRMVWGPALGVVLAAQALALFDGAGLPLPAQLAIHCTALFVGCMALHGDLVRLRPDPAHLTRFYLATALGGALGGVLVGVVAPRLLTLRFELHLAMVAVPLLFLYVAWRERQAVEMRGEPGWVWLLPLGLVAGLGLALAVQISGTARGAEWVARGFHGVLKVKSLPEGARRGPSRRLLHGNIMHGLQYTDERRPTPTSYYGPRSGIGLLFRWGAERPPRQVATVGLGVGTIAAFGRCGDTLDFYEIDPLVEVAAREWFSYLPDSCAESRVRIGDGRLLLSRAAETYDVIVLDGFTGDAVPTHLLTREAFEIYDARLARDGVLAVNVSNRHLDLRPVVRAHADALGMAFSNVTSRPDYSRALNLARWVLLSRRADLHAWLLAQGELDDVDESERLDWTDDHAPLWPLLRAFRG